MSKGKATMKTLTDIQQDMSALYDDVKNGSMELKAASELANIAGKYLKAEQLILAREIFTSATSRLGRNVENAAALTLAHSKD